MATKATMESTQAAQLKPLSAAFAIVSKRMLIAVSGFVDQGRVKGQVQGPPGTGTIWRQE